jgi:uncharacterized membrane protein
MPNLKTSHENLNVAEDNGFSLNRVRLYVRFVLAFLVLSIFSVLLLLVFFQKIDPAMETVAATMLGGLISVVHAVISYFFDSTEHNDDKETRRIEINGTK